MSETKADKAKPLVPSGIMTEFGAVLDDPSHLLDEAGQGGDLTYIPGFSDQRREYDLAVKAGEKPTPLTMNCRWVRRTKVNGNPDNRKQIQHKNTGYRAATKDDVGQAWMTELPPSAEILPDGSIGLGDTVLMVTDAKTAGRNQLRKKLKWLDSVSATRDAAIKRAGDAVKGSNPQVVIER